MTRTIYFDMDGTIANLYAVENWLPMLRSEDATPYEQAAPMLRMCQLARLLHKAQKNGWKVGIVSWLAKNSTKNYDAKVTTAKLKWLKSHLKSVDFDEIHIVAYGTPKHEIVNDKNGILFDDEVGNRETWTGTAYDVNNIIEVLKEIA